MHRIYFIETILVFLFVLKVLIKYISTFESTLPHTVTPLLLSPNFHSSRKCFWLAQHGYSPRSTVNLTIAIENGVVLPEHPANWLPLGYLAQNAYDRYPADFHNVTSWSIERSFGWNDVGIRGFVFINDEHSNLIVALKGTSISSPFSTPTDEIPTDNNADIEEVQSCLILELI